MSLNKGFSLSAILILCAVSIIGVVYFKVLGNPLSKPNAALSVSASYEQASVILDGSLVGKTPYESKTLKPGDHTLSLKSDSGDYETKIKLVPQAQTAVSREVGTGGSFSSGYTVWMEKVSSSETLVSVISSPTEATVKLDNEEKGKTPISLNDVNEGNHTIEISKTGYETQAIYLKFKRGFKLNVVADLFLLPIPESLESINYSDKIRIYNLALSEAAITVDSATWAKASAYYGKTRGKPLGFNYFVDYNGAVYDSNGLKVTLSPTLTVEGNIIIGYLAQNKEDLSEKAKEALAIFGNAKPQELAEIIPTGVGWLRVRAEPTLDSSEVTKVNVGEKFSILEEKGNWIKIKINETTEGWVSATYVRKVTQ